MKYGSWSFLAESKGAAIEMLCEQNRQWLGGGGALTEDELRDTIAAIERLDLSMPPPDEGVAICDGWRWILEISFDYRDEDGLVREVDPLSRAARRRFVREISINAKPLIYGLRRVT